MSRIIHPRAGVIIAIGLVLAVPFYATDFWIQAGLFSMAVIVGAIGLTLLTGVAGQLSLGHAFFAALGAYTYSFLAGGSSERVAGLGLPPILAFISAAATAGLAGAIFSPVAGRIRGIYLGLATLGLVFLGRHLILNADDLTGGFNGRNVEPFSIFGFSFSNSQPDYLALAGVQFEGLHRLWYLFLCITVVAGILGRNLRSSRIGRAWANLKVSETAAGTMGIDVSRAKASAFITSSAYAGTAGALMALAYGRISPDLFGMQLSIDFLIMVVIGGLGSIAGAAVGAVFVVVVPLILVEYSSDLPFLALPGSGGVDAGTLSRYVYAVAIIVVLLFMHGGLAGAFGRLWAKVKPNSASEAKAAPEQPVIPQGLTATDDQVDDAPTGLQPAGIGEDSRQ